MVIYGLFKATDYTWFLPICWSDTHKQWSSTWAPPSRFLTWHRHQARNISIWLCPTSRKNSENSMAKWTMTGNPDTLPSSGSSPAAPRAEWRWEVWGIEVYQREAARYAPGFWFSFLLQGQFWITLARNKGWQGQLPSWALFKPRAQKSDRWGRNSLHAAKEGPVWVQSADFQADLNPTLGWGLWDFRSLWKFPRALNIPGFNVLPQPWPAWGTRLPKNTQIIFRIASFLHNFKQKSESPFFRWGNCAISCESKARSGFSGLPVSQNIISGTFWLPFNYSSSGFLSLHKFHSILPPHPHA